MTYTNLCPGLHPCLKSTLGLVLGALSLSALGQAEVVAQDNRQIPGYQSDGYSRLDNLGDDAWSIVLGAAALYGPLSDGGGESEFFTVPLINITYRDFAYIGIAEGVGFNLVSNDKTFLSVGANFASSRSDDDEEDSFFNDGDFERFAGLGDVDGDVAIELYASHIVFDVLELSTAVTREFGDVDGWQATLGAASGMPVTDTIFLGGTISATWSSENYAQALWGVTGIQAQNRLAIAATNPLIAPYDTFDAGAGFTDVTIGIGLSKIFGKYGQFFATLDGGYTLGLGDLKNSPITERANTFNAAFTIGWQF